MVPDNFLDKYLSKILIFGRFLKWQNTLTLEIIEAIIACLSLGMPVLQYKNSGLTFLITKIKFIIPHCFRSVIKLPRLSSSITNNFH